MITEDYVSFETAKLLKEKGFDADIDLWYNSDGEIFHLYHYDYNATKYFACVQCPTLQMVMKWLREEHNLFVEIQYATSLLLQPHTTIYFQIYYMSLDYTTSGKNMLPDDYIREYYTSYEDACEAAIKYCLENLI